MRKRAFFIILILIVIAAFTIRKLNLYPSIKSFIGNQGAENVRLQQIKDITLAGGANILDYQSIDYSTNRLYISHLGSNMLHVFDLRKQKIIKDILLRGSPYGVLAVPSLKKVFVSIGGVNEVAVIDENTLQVITYIQAGDTPDGLAFYPLKNEIFVSNENGGTVSVTNAQSNERITDISIGGEVGNSHYFEKDTKIYTAAGDDNKLVEIDPETNKVSNKYPLIGCIHPHGFYIDQQNHYAFITCDVNNVLLIFDLDTKKIIASDTVGAVPDVLAYDEVLHHLYVAGESGILTIFAVQKGNVKKIYEGFIAPHAHTVAVDQLTHLVYFPLENINGKPVLRIEKPIIK